MTDAVRASPQKEISHEVVRIYKEFLGRGPKRAQTIIADDYVVTVCEESLTKAEIKLVEKGDDETVRAIRRKFQLAMQREIIDVIERVTARRARALLSDHDVVDDIAVEVVVLVPETAAS